MTRIPQSRAKEADAIVRALAAIHPAIEGGDGIEVCGVCKKVEHKSDCPWVMAREYVAEMGINT